LRYEQLGEELQLARDAILRAQERAAAILCENLRPIAIEGAGVLRPGGGGEIGRREADARASPRHRSEARVEAGQIAGSRKDSRRHTESRGAEVRSAEAAQVGVGRNLAVASQKRTTVASSGHDGEARALPLPSAAGPDDRFVDLVGPPVLDPAFRAGEVRTQYDVDYAGERVATVNRR